MDFKTVMGPKEYINVYPNIGKVSYKRNLKAKRLSIRIKNTGEVKVTIPSVLSFNAAENFVLSKASWIVEKLKEIETQKQPIIQNGFNTRYHSLRFISGDYQSIKVKYNKPHIDILYPESIEIGHKSSQTAAKKAIELAYRIEAKEYLPQRLDNMATLKGFKYGKLTIRNSLTRWGSCSSKNNISLSFHLMKLPDELIDYILLHELCHTVQKNHGPKFWELLNKVTDGRAKQLAKEVKKYSTRI